MPVSTPAGSPPDRGAEPIEPNAGTPAEPRASTRSADAAWSVERYRDRVLAACLTGGWPRVEDVPLDVADGRVSAGVVRARVAVPRFANSAMDGFGFAYADDATARVWTVAGEVPAGVSRTGGPGPGEVVRIMTGAPVPVSVDTVVPLEDAEVTGDGVRFTRSVRPGQHVRLAGEDVTEGDVVLVPGIRLSARHLAAAAAVGVDTLAVAAAPRVAVLTTGDELAAPGAALGPAVIPDSNGPFLVSAVGRAGGTVAWRGHAGDEPEDVRHGLDEAVAAGADLVLVTGGVSAGDRDATRAVLAASGAFVAVAMQPGKPQGYGVWRGVPVIALPGNPVSVAVSFACFVRPVMDAMVGVAPPVVARGVVAEGWRSPAGRRQFMPVSAAPDADGRLALRPATPGGSGSHLVVSLARADVLAVVPEDITDVAVGTVLDLVDLL